MPKARKKILSLPIATALLVLLVGNIAKVQHWPFGFTLYATGLMSLGVFYALRYVLKTNKNIKDAAKGIMVLTWVLFNLLTLYNYTELQYIAVVSLTAGLGWLLNEIKDFFFYRDKIDKLNVVLWIGVLLMATSVIVKIKHLPGGSLLQFSGILFSALGFAIDYTLKKRRTVHDSTYTPVQDHSSNN